jgi:hypothetical protein
MDSLQSCNKSHTKTIMNAKQSIRIGANFSLLCVFAEATAWRVRHWVDHVKLVAHVTVGCSPNLAALLIISTCVAEQACALASLRLRDGRLAALLLLPQQLAAYALFQTRSLPVVLALLLACLQTTESLGRKKQELNGDGTLTRIEKHGRSMATRANVAAPMVVLVVMEVIGAVWRVGSDGYEASINHDRSVFSLSLMTLALRLASFDEDPCSYLRIARDRVGGWVDRAAPVVAPVYARARAGATWVWMQRARPGNVTRDGSKKL